MCHFITAVLPADADAARVEAIARRHGRDFRPFANVHVQRQLAPGERYFITTVDHCDCGTPLGMANRTRAPTVSDGETRAAKWRRAGWSEAKIARALGQREASHDEDVARQATQTAGELAAWTALVDEALASRATGYLGLLLHFGDAEDDFAVQRTLVPRTRPVSEALAGIAEDALTVFGRASAA